MELPGKYKNKLAELKKAISGFEEALKVDLFSYSATVMDLMRNGQIQKFEYCSELLWKTGKTFLEERNGVIVNSPKSLYKGMFQNGHIDEVTCEKLILMVDDRNLLSHIYNENYFEKVILRLPDHLQLIKQVYERISTKN